MHKSNPEWLHIDRALQLSLKKLKILYPGTLKGLPLIQSWPHKWLPMCQHTVEWGRDHQHFFCTGIFPEKLLVTCHSLILTPSLTELCSSCRSLAFRAVCSPHCGHPAPLFLNLYTTLWIWVLIRGLRCSPGNSLDAPQARSQIRPSQLLWQRRVFSLENWDVERDRAQTSTPDWMGHRSGRFPSIPSKLLLPRW